MNRLLRLTLIRHGETTLNKQHVCQGHTDAPLTPLGLSQAKKCGTKLSKNFYNKIYTSDLIRAQDTCYTILNENEFFGKQPENDMYLDRLHMTKMIRERFYGDVDGIMPVADYIANAEKEGLPLREYVPAKNAENLDALWNRAEKFTRLLIKDSNDMHLATNKYEFSSLVVSHAIFLKEFITYLDHTYKIGGLTEDKMVGILSNTSSSEFMLEIQNDKIVKIDNLIWNDVSHLE